MPRKQQPDAPDGGTVTVRTRTPTWIAGTEYAAGVELVLATDEADGLVRAGYVTPITQPSEET